MMAALPAFAIVFLLVFQEFEIASLMQISRAPVAWTVWLFDNHAGWLMPSRSLQLSIVPVLCELVVVGAVFVALLRSDWHQTESLTKTKRTSEPLRWTATVFLVAAIVMCVGIPLWRMGSGVAGGIVTLRRQPEMLSKFLVCHPGPDRVVGVKSCRTGVVSTADNAFRIRHSGTDASCTNAVPVAACGLAADRVLFTTTTRTDLCCSDDGGVRRW
jgi:hypothetical protein